MKVKLNARTITITNIRIGTLPGKIAGAHYTESKKPECGERITDSHYVSIEIFRTRPIAINGK
ncbi:MAG: hypothetical protein DHS20C05_02330 [Hyphococcus sp.]|nr:MAG: hypothetical protein DHS20C05_02330 [Marinicaulis sp.]